LAAVVQAPPIQLLQLKVAIQFFLQLHQLVAATVCGLVKQEVTAVLAVVAVMVVLAVPVQRARQYKVITAAEVLVEV
jgi:hypothetical protein